MFHSVYLIFLILAIVFAAIFTVRRSTKTDAVSLLLKAVASLCFILLGFAGIWFGASASYVCLLIPAGLVCGLIGDIFLDLKFVYPQDETLHTFSGFGAFILGHLFYMLYLFLFTNVQTTLLLISIGVGILAGILIYATPKLMKLDYGKYRLISACYAALLVFVTVYALLLEIVGGHAISRLLFGIGLVLFLISDLILSQIYFGANKNTTLNKALNHATYYAGQILIAMSVFFAA